MIFQQVPITLRHLEKRDAMPNCRTSVGSRTNGYRQQESLKEQDADLQTLYKIVAPDGKVQGNHFTGKKLTLSEMPVCMLRMIPLPNMK